MNEREISTDFFDIISDYHKGSKMYIEAKESVNKGDAKSTQQLKNFLKSITKVDSKSKDPRITSTKGNFQKFKSADIVKEAFSMLGKNDVNDLKVIYDALIKYAPQYEESYAKGSRIIQLEYESAVYILVTGLSAKMSQITDIKDGKLTRNQVKFTYIEDMTKKMSAVLSASNHKEYLDSLLSIATDHIIKDNLNESAEEMYFEASFGDVANLINAGVSAIGNGAKLGVKAFNTVKNTVFGIVPLIRGIAYLKYNRKADTINALEDQIVYIKDNIEQLKNRTNMDPKEKAKIIKRQEAVIEKYKKKAAKLRAQLFDSEAEAAREIKKDDPNMKKTTPNDEMVLEGVDLGVLFEEDYENYFDESMDEEYLSEAAITPRTLSNIFKGFAAKNDTSIISKISSLSHIRAQGPRTETMKYIFPGMKIKMPADALYKMKKEDLVNVTKALNNELTDEEKSIIQQLEKAVFEKFAFDKKIQNEFNNNYDAAYSNPKIEEEGHHLIKRLNKLLELWNDKVSPKLARIMK